jgi:putative ABC transport system substrate-binding protein
MTPGPAPTRRLVLAAAGAWLLPRAACAQIAKRRRIAFLAPGSRSFVEPYLEAFRQGLHALGYGDEDTAIEIRYADRHMERLPDLAAELVRLNPEVIVTGSVPGVQAAKHATLTIPIVMTAVVEPVAAGFVASLAHPGGNITGLSTQEADLAGKWLQLLKTVMPDVERIAILVNPSNPVHVPMLQIARQAARTLRTELLAVEVRAPDEIDSAFAAMKHEDARALIVPGDPTFTGGQPTFSGGQSRIVELAASYKLPAISLFREFVAVGGLMSYGPDLSDLFRRSAAYVDKILKGAKPADLPVEQPTKFQFVVNLKTAQTLGLTLPQSIFAVADEVIE